MYFPHNLTTLDLVLILLLIVCVVYLYDQQVRLRKQLPFTHKPKDIKILSVVAGEMLDTTEIEKALYTTDINYNLLHLNSVSKESFLAEIEKDVTLVEISTHGLNGAFRLGNDVLPATWLGQVLDQYPKLDCALLLYCNSYLDLELLAHGRFVIGTVGQISDNACITFARHFYFFLNKQYDYKDAFERARLHLDLNDFSNIRFMDGR